jgi:hypothetical protein
MMRRTTMRPLRTTVAGPWRPGAGWPAAVLTLTLLAGVLATSPAAASSAPAAAEAQLAIHTLSNRADLISGGDALVEIARTDGGSVGNLTVTLNGEDISAVFAERDSGRVQGLVTGLEVGENTIVAESAQAASARLVLTNHPIGGPVFSGEQVQPWACTTEQHGLGPPQDEQCNADPVQRWRYRTTSGSFADYDIDDPPSNVAMTTTDQGQTVPYVFVVETGAMNRGIYRFAMLADPEQPLVPWQHPRGWNGGIYYKFGPSCGTQYNQGSPSENVEDNRALSQGYAVATSSLSVLGSNCNTVTSAESLMMLQERIVELFGPISHTRGKGGSGGAIGQFVVASGYPGLLQGLNVDMAYSDFWTTLTEVADCHLLLNYFTTTSPHLWADVAAQGLVTGHMSIATCWLWEVAFTFLLDPTTGCGAGQAYHPVDRPDGCRATVQDLQANILGRRPPAVWSGAEQAAGRGFAELPYDNTGRLYGLNALRVGAITPSSSSTSTSRSAASTSTGTSSTSAAPPTPRWSRRCTATGLVASGETLSETPIIDVRAAIGNAEFHTNFHSWALRERLINAQGHHDNQSIWQLLEVPNLPSVAGPESFAAMSSWLHAIDADDSDDPIQDKIARNRPDGAEDSCLIMDQKSNDMSRCALFTYFGNPAHRRRGTRIQRRHEMQTRPCRRYGRQMAASARCRSPRPSARCSASGTGCAPASPKGCATSAGRGSDRSPSSRGRRSPTGLAAPPSAPRRPGNP